MIAIVLFTIAAERIPDISPIPYSAPRLLLILLLIAPTSHSTPPYSRTRPMIPDTRMATILMLNISLIPLPIAWIHSKNPQLPTQSPMIPDASIPTKRTTATLTPISAAMRTMKYGRTSIIL